MPKLVSGIHTCSNGDHGCTEICQECRSCAECCDCEKEDGE